MAILSSTALTDKPASGHMALLIVDMISCWDFPDADKLLPGALQMMPRLARLKARCRDARVPVIYANDNRGGWRSDSRELVEKSEACGGDAARISEGLRPTGEDYFLLKPRHSAFWGTPLELLLRHLKVRCIIVTGVSSDQCVLLTAGAARMRDLDVIVPRDGVATQSRQRAAAAHLIFSEAMGLPTTPCARLRLGATP
jgi:nicotinamidase-related amidase